MLPHHWIAATGAPIVVAALAACGSFAQTIQALQQHAVDAASMPEPFVTQARQRIGAVEVLDLLSKPARSGWPTT